MVGKRKFLVQSLLGTMKGVKMDTKERENMHSVLDEVLDRREKNGGDPTKSTKKTVVAFLLDETQSMGVCRDETIKAFNEYVGTIRGNDNWKFALTRFNSGNITTENVVPVKDAIELSHDNYNPSNMTPLYDAIGKTIQQVEGSSDNDTAVLFVILTDGAENSSREFDKEKALEFINKKTEAGWTFAYIGAGQEAWSQGLALNIPKGNTIAYSHKNIDKVFATASASTQNYCAAGSATTKELFSGQNTDLV